MQKIRLSLMFLMNQSYVATLLTVGQFLCFSFFGLGRGVVGGRNFLIDKNKTKQKPNYTCTTI